MQMLDHFTNSTVLCGIKEIERVGEREGGSLFACHMRLSA